jgi:hypothetical protein
MPEPRRALLLHAVYIATKFWEGVEQEVEPMLMFSTSYLSSHPHFLGDRPCYAKPWDWVSYASSSL